MKKYMPTIKPILVALMWLVIAPHVSAQIEFDHGTMAEALAKAKKENKPVFVDVWATWCGPCKRMAATAFMEPVVAEMYNAHFVNLKIDGEKGEGPEIMRKFGITAFPTLLYINPDGTLFKKVVGMMDKEALLAKGNEILHPETSPVYMARKQYVASDRGPEALRNYVSVLAAQQDDSLNYYTGRYYQMKRPLDLKDQFDVFVFYHQEKDINSANSAYFLEHPTEFDQATYTGKIKEWINASFADAVNNHNYSIVETAVNKLFPYWEKAEVIGQSKEDYLKFVRSQYDRYAGS